MKFKEVKIGDIVAIDFYNLEQRLITKVLSTRTYISASNGGEVLLEMPGGTLWFGIFENIKKASKDQRFLYNMNGMYYEKNGLFIDEESACLKQ